MTAQPRRRRDREPGPAASPRRAPSRPAGHDIVAGTASHVGLRPHSRQLANFVEKALRLIGLSRDLLCDQMRPRYLATVKVGRRNLIARQHLQQLFAIAT
jgi:hypothetical protein